MNKGDVYVFMALGAVAVLAAAVCGGVTLVRSWLSKRAEARAVWEPHVEVGSGGVRVVVRRVSRRGLRCRGRVWHVLNKERVGPILDPTKDGYYTRLMESQSEAVARASTYNSLG